VYKGSGVLARLLYHKRVERYSALLRVRTLYYWFGGGIIGAGAKPPPPLYGSVIIDVRAFFEAPLLFGASIKGEQVLLLPPSAYCWLC